MNDGAPSSPTYDLVVFGATSFVGQLVVDHLLSRHGDGSDRESSLRWAVAGRNRQKLEDLLETRDASLPMVEADAGDRAALDRLVADTRAVVSTVGPYALYGSDLIAAAVAAGTDYCDLTGEAQWMQQMIDRHHDDAVASGARIVHSCGFDSIPSDLGVWYTQARATEHLGQPCSRIAMRVKAIKGGASGGTIASAINVFDDVAKDPSLRKVLANPYALAPVGQRDGVKQPNVLAPTADEGSGQWAAPFIMAAVNTKIVLRSHALLGRPWGDDFLYDEAILTGEGPVGLAKATATTAGLGGFVGAASIGPIRGLLKDRVLPKPGTGPNQEARESGFFDLRFYGATPDGDQIQTKVTGDRDPGYGSTAKMLGETAAAFLDLDRDAVGGGFLTPAVAFGDLLIDRLIRHSGMTFAVVDQS